MSKRISPPFRKLQVVIAVVMVSTMVLMAWLDGVERAANYYSIDEKRVNSELSANYDSREINNSRRDTITLRKDGHSQNGKIISSNVHTSVEDNGMSDKRAWKKFSNADFLSNDSDVYANITCVSDVSMTDVTFSNLALIDWHAGKSEVNVSIVTYNSRNQPRTSGGDVIVIWAEQEAGDGRAAGMVADHWDGTYSGTVRVFWSGQTVIKVKLLSTAENTCVRRNSLLKYGITSFAMAKSWGIMAEYRHGAVIEKARCGVRVDMYGLTRVCNFTQLNDGKHWYCGAPLKAKLDCQDLFDFDSSNLNRRNVIPNQSEAELIRKIGHGVFDQVIKRVNVRYVPTHNRRQLPQCSVRPVVKSWTGDVPSGYFFNGTWHIRGCRPFTDFTVRSYRRCLANKHVYVLGDSTFRQYAQYLADNVLSVPFVRVNDTYRRQFHKYMKTHNHNITVEYKKHEMPFHYKDVGRVGITSFPTEINKIAQSTTPGSQQILLIGANTHFQAHPPEEYELRIKYMCEAIKKLLRRKPQVTVFIKGPHVTIEDIRWFDSRISLLYRDIVYRYADEFKHRVIFLDVWSISIAHNSELIHPLGDALTSQIQQMMSYLCKSEAH